MIEQVSAVADHVVGIRINGSVDADQMDTALAAFGQKFAEHERISYYAEVVDFDGLSFQALLKNLGYGAKSLRQFSQIWRIALVTDVGWVETAAKWQSRVFSNIQLRTFASEDRDEAVAWINETPPPARTSVTELPVKQPTGDGHPLILAFEVDGPFTRSDIEHMTAAIDGIGPFRLLLNVKHFGGVTPGMIGSGFAKLKLAGMQNLDRYAVVGAPDWMEDIAEAMNPLLKFDVRMFDSDELDEAWSWIRE